MLELQVIPIAWYVSDRAAHFWHFLCLFSLPLCWCIKFSLAKGRLCTDYSLRISRQFHIMGHRKKVPGGITMHSAFSTKDINRVLVVSRRYPSERITTLGPIKTFFVEVLMPLLLLFLLPTLFTLLPAHHAFAWTFPRLHGLLRVRHPLEDCVLLLLRKELPRLIIRGRIPLLPHWDRPLQKFQRHSCHLRAATLKISRLTPPQWSALKSQLDQLEHLHT
mmetsp:Transcript_60461/g.179128  ORF Transcript_60461/g.179128 Transcript_60461/m.179128 type:complete len:220 (+) Transcript_60461:309-968(+)